MKMLLLCLVYQLTTTLEHELLFEREKKNNVLNAWIGQAYGSHNSRGNRSASEKN